MFFDKENLLCKEPLETRRRVDPRSWEVAVLTIPSHLHTLMLIVGIGAVDISMIRSPFIFSQVFRGFLCHPPHRVPVIWGFCHILNTDLKTTVPYTNNDGRNVFHWVSTKSQRWVSVATAPLPDIPGWLVEKAASLSSGSRSVALQLLLLSEVRCISANEGEINSPVLSDGQQLKEETATAWPRLTETHVNTQLSIHGSSSLSSAVSPPLTAAPPFPSLPPLCPLPSLIPAPSTSAPFQLFLQSYLPPPPSPPVLLLMSQELSFYLLLTANK